MDLSQATVTFLRPDGSVEEMTVANFVLAVHRGLDGLLTTVEAKKSFLEDHLGGMIFNNKTLFTNPPVFQIEQAVRKVLEGVTRPYEDEAFIVDRVKPRNLEDQAWVIGELQQVDRNNGGEPGLPDEPTPAAGPDEAPGEPVIANLDGGEGGEILPDSSVEERYRREFEKLLSERELSLTDVIGPPREKPVPWMIGMMIEQLRILEEQNQQANGPEASGTSNDSSAGCVDHTLQPLIMPALEGYEQSEGPSGGDAGPVLDVKAVEVKEEAVEPEASGTSNDLSAGGVEGYLPPQIDEADEQSEGPSVDAEAETDPTVNAVDVEADSAAIEPLDDESRRDV
jgi:hypothetical protein